MAYDYNSAKEKYEKLTDAQKQTFANDTSGYVQDFLKRYNAEKAQTNTTPTSTVKQASNGISQASLDANKNNAKAWTWYVAPIPEKDRLYKQDDIAKSIAEKWNWLDYETQQKKLQTVAGMKEYLDSKWITSKTAPEQPTTTTPTTPTKATTTKQTTPQQQQWDYQDNSQARKDQILDHLNTYRTTNPELFEDASMFYNFFIDWNGRSQEQIDLLWDYFNRVQKYGKYDNLPASSIWDMLVNGKLPEDYLNYLKSTDPQKYQEALSYRQDAEDTIKYESYLSDVADQAWVWWFEKFYTWIFGYKDENKDNIDDSLYIAPTEEEQTKQNRVNTIDSRIMEIKNMQKNLLDDLTEQYPWVPKATLMWIVQDRTKDLQREYDDLMVERTWLVWNIEYMQNERDMQSKARQSTINNLEKAYWMYYDYTAEWISEMAQYKYAATNITLDQADQWTDTQKQMALEKVLTPLYEKYWSIIQRSPAQVINDVIALSKSEWISLSEAFEKNFMSQLRSKPQFATISSWWSVWWASKYATIKDWNWNVIMYDTTSWDYEIVWWTWTQTTSTWWTITNSYWKSYTPISYTQLESWLSDFLLPYNDNWTTKWWQCWAFVNNWLKAAWVITENIYDNSLDSKLKSKNEEANTTADAGWVAIRNPDSLSTANWKKHWHVWFVLSDNWNTVTVMDSNWLDLDKDWVYDETTYVHDVPKSSLYWYFNPTKEYGNVWSVDSIMTEYWVPLTFHNAIWGDIPTKEKDNVNEKADIQSRIKALYESWLDANTASVVYKWWNVQAWVEPELSNQLLTILLSSSEMPENNQFRRIANFINKGQTDVAIKMTEEFIDSQAKDDIWYVSELQTRNVLNKSSSLKNYVKWLNKNPIWNFSWTVEQWLWKFKSTESKQIKSYLADIENYLRDTMNIDDDRIKDIVPQLDDSIKDFAAKLNQLESNQLALLNNWRKMYFLPTLKVGEVWKPDTRYSVYQRSSGSSWFSKAK